MRTSRFFLGALLLSTGCAVTPDTGDQIADGVVLTADEEKQDNFLSVTGREFIVEGRTTVTIEEALRDASDEEKLERARQLIGLKQLGISWFLSQYLIEKESDAANVGYGGPGHGALAKANGYEGLDIRAEDELTFSFTFRQLIAGDPNLIVLLTEDSEDGKFDLIVGKPTNEELARITMNEEWYRQAPWDDFNPENVAEERKETLRLSIEPERDSRDAWLEYGAFFEDGKLDIDVHFGWDYHASYHVAHARSLFNWLRSHGYSAPVSTFDELDHESGAFTKTIEANGREVTIEVRIFYGKTGGENDPDTADGAKVQEADMRESFRQRDVIMYSGHSGPLYGFSLANWRVTLEGDLDDSEIEALELPRERQQLVVAEACDTYHVGEAFRRNPAKRRENEDGTASLAYIDVITTTSSSDASSPEAVEDVIASLTETNRAGQHQPRTVSSLLRDLDDNSWRFEMYGLHGVDDNSHAHPYGDSAMLCESCSTDADCGGPGNRCVSVGGSRHCATACTADDGCAEGYACRAVASGSAIYDHVCAPTANRCE